MMRSRRGVAAAVLAGLCLAGLAHADAPPLLGDVEALTGFSKKDIQKLSDAPIATKLDVDRPNREAAFAALVRLSTDGADLLTALRQHDLAEGTDGYEGFGRFAVPARSADVAAVAFPEDDIEVLPACRRGECKFKLSGPQIDGLGQIDWKQPSAGATFTRNFHGWVGDYVQGYRTHGRGALIEYADKPKPVEVADTILGLAGRFGFLGRAIPGLPDDPFAEPAPASPQLESALTWTIKNFGYRPTFAIDEVSFGQVSEGDGITNVFMINTLYANHYLAGRVQLGALIDGDVGLGVPGHFILLVDRIEFDDDLNMIKRGLLGRGLLADIETRIARLRTLADGA